MLCFILMPKLFWSHIAQSYFEHYQQLEKLQEKENTTVFEKMFIKKKLTKYRQAQKNFLSFQILSNFC